MTDRDLRKLKRQALLELLLEKTEENEKLTAELEEARALLSRREIAVNEAGTLAEAAVSINGMLSAADETARQYLENIRHTDEQCQQMIEDAKREAEEILRRAREEAGRGVVPEPETAPEEKPRMTASELSQGMKERFDRSFELMVKKNKR